MGKIRVRNMSVRDFLSYQKGRHIPGFKLRYTWDERNTETLIMDINEASSLSSYSIGTAVYAEEGCIDGLGRIITLSMIARLLGLPYPDVVKRWTAEELRRLKRCSQAAERALSFVDMSVFPSFFYDCTYITLIEIDEIRDCFPFFDSGSERGVSLDPADLLKAYHLCSMRDRNEGEKLSVISEWEAIGRDGISSLLSLWHPLLYWSRGISAPPFSFMTLSAFEGIEESLDFPFVKSLRSAGHSLISPVINGRLFFERCFHYHRMKKALDCIVSEVFPSLSGSISSDCPAEISCLSLFETLSLLMLDRFGEAAVRNALPVIFRFSFSLRLEDSSVPWDKINSHVLSPDSILPLILYSLSPYDVYSYDLRSRLGDMRNVAFRTRGPVRPIDWDEDFRRWLG